MSSHTLVCATKLFYRALASVVSVILWIRLESGTWTCMLIVLCDSYTCITWAYLTHTHTHKQYTTCRYHEGITTTYQYKVSHRWVVLHSTSEHLFAVREVDAVVGVFVKTVSLRYSYHDNQHHGIKLSMPMWAFVKEVWSGHGGKFHWIWCRGKECTSRMTSYDQNWL